MRIGIDIRRATGDMTGVGVYISELLSALQRVAAENDYRLFLDTRNRFGIWKRPWFLELIYKQTILPLDLIRARCNVLFVPNPPVPFWGSCPAVVTIHDMTFWVFGREWFQFLLYWVSSRLAAHIVTDSESSKRDIVRFLGVQSSKVTVIPCAYSRRYRPLDREMARNRVSAHFGFEGRYILLVAGTLCRRKGAYDLVEAFVRLPAKLRLQRKVLIVAKRDTEDAVRFSTFLKRIGFSEYILVTGYVEEEILPDVYNGADVLAFPSLYEGFGLPPLEAMACGTPVIAYNATSVPEVLGEAGVLVEPGDVMGLSVGLTRILEDKVYAQGLMQAGLRRAAHFSWEDSAHKLLEVFRLIVSGSN